MRRARRRAAAAALFLFALGPTPAAAFDLFATHEVTVHFAFPDGKPMADVPVRVFAPGKPDKPELTGRTDRRGKFAFSADRNGLWSAEAHSKKEIARVTIRVGGGERQPGGPISRYWLWGGLFLLLVVAFGYRILRARARRPKS